MKKLLAIILSVICAFSCLALPANASVVGEVATDFFERLFDLEVEEDTMLGYGVFYEMEILSGVSVIYKPSPSIKFENPGTYTITNDTPLSIDYEFVCWEDKDGNTYYAGDKIYVDGQITLYAVWVEKNDNDIRLARVIKTTVEALRRLIGKFLGFFDIVVEFNENYKPTNPEDPRYYDLTLNQIVYEDNGKIYVYLDSAPMYEKNLVRITPSEPCTVYLCTGWNEATEEPIDKVEYSCTYTFSEMQATNNSDVMIIDVSEVDTTAFEGSTYYMVFSVNESIYNSPVPQVQVYPEYTNPISGVFTFKAEN